MRELDVSGHGRDLPALPFMAYCEAIGPGLPVPTDCVGVSDARATCWLERWWTEHRGTTSSFG